MLFKYSYYHPEKDIVEVCDTYSFLCSVLIPIFLPNNCLPTSLGKSPFYSHCSSKAVNHSPLLSSSDRVWSVKTSTLSILFTVTGKEIVCDSSGLMSSPWHFPAESIWKCPLAFRVVLLDEYKFGAALKIQVV